NMMGVFTLLDAAHRSWETRTNEEKAAFRFVHVSTDEVFGALGDTGYFTEETLSGKDIRPNRRGMRK
ncbi:MAG: hypothetical protein EOO01_18815, partial [Chitinophagaceae bacterium]